jgi:opacity protein-like surface antigen
MGNGSLEGSDHAFGRHLYGIINQDFGPHTFTFMARTDETGVSNDNTTGADTTDDSYTVGGGVELVFGSLILDAAGYYYRGGDAARFTENDNTVDYKAASGTVEAVYSFTSNILGLVRYDWHDTLDSVASENQWVASLQYYFVPNVKLNLEYVNREIDVGGNINRTEADDQQLNIWLRFGF